MHGRIWGWTLALRNVGAGGWFAGRALLTGYWNVSSTSLSVRDPRNWGLLRSQDWHTPPASIDRLFEPVDLSKVPLIGEDTSGMGLDKRQFYAANFAPQIFINNELECADRMWPG